MAKTVITIGRSLGKKTAGQAKVVLNKRYPGKSKEIDACIAKHFGKDKGAEKLNADGDTGTNKSESTTPKK